MVLLGKKKIHSNKKDADFYQVCVSFAGDPGFGLWCDNVFVDQLVFDNINADMYGHKIKFVYEYNGNRNPRIAAVEVIDE